MSTAVTSYQFEAKIRKKRGDLLLTCHLSGLNFECEPELEHLQSGDPGELLFRLIFRPYISGSKHGCCTVVQQPPKGLQRIRIILPDYQEFIIHNLKVELDAVE